MHLAPYLGFWLRDAPPLDIAGEIAHVVRISTNCHQLSSIVSNCQQLSATVPASGCAPRPRATSPARSRLWCAPPPALQPLQPPASQRPHPLGLVSLYSGVTLNVARPDMNNYATLGVMLY
jgi:hypothetical protein